MNRRTLILVSTLVGAAAGAGGGYIFARMQLEAKYEALASKEIDEAREYFSKLYKGPGYETPEQVLEQRVFVDEVMPEPDIETLDNIVERMNYGKVSNKTPIITSQTLTAKPKTRNVFENLIVDDEGNWAAEEAMRNPDHPYIISFEEYNEGFNSHSQVTLTYFEADDTLVEPNDVPVDNVDYLVGNANLDRFGHRSKDQNVVYVRNCRVGIDYEICRSKGSFAEEVGGDPEPRPRKRTNRSNRG